MSLKSPCLPAGSLLAVGKGMWSPCFSSDTGCHPTEASLLSPFPSCVGHGGSSVCLLPAGALCGPKDGNHQGPSCQALWAAAEHTAVARLPAPLPGSRLCEWDALTADHQMLVEKAVVGRGGGLHSPLWAAEVGGRQTSHWSNSAGMGRCSTENTAERQRRSETALGRDTGRNV